MCAGATKGIFMGLYISDDYGLGDFDLALVVLATDTIEFYLERSQWLAMKNTRRRRTRPRSDESRWTLPPK